MTRMSNAVSIVLISLMLLPSLGAIVPADAESVTVEEEGWWVDTTVDRNKNGIGDMIERHIDNPILLKDGTLPIIVDFDHTPDEKDVVMLFFGIGMQHGLTLEEIGAKFDLTRERVRQIKEKAIRRLRHNSRSKLLKAYLG